MNYRTLGLGTLFALGLAHPVLAHGVQVDYQIIPNAAAPQQPHVTLQAQFDSGTAIAHAQVEVYAPDHPEQPWVTGKADPNGHFSFTPNQPGNWQIKIRQAGHGAFFLIPISGKPSAVSVVNTHSHGLPPLQRGLGTVLVIGSCVGVALYCRSRKR